MRSSPLIREYYGGFGKTVRRFQEDSFMEHFRRHGTNVVPIYDFFASHLLFDFITQPDFISYQYMDRDRPAFRIIKGLYGVQEFSWTVRDEELADFLKKEGSLVIFEGYNNKLDEEE